MTMEFIASINNVEYASKAAFDSVYDMVNTYLDSLGNGSYAEIVPHLNTKEGSETVSADFRLHITITLRSQIETRLNQIQGADGLFPGSYAICRYTEDFVIDTE